MLTVLKMCIHRACIFTEVKIPFKEIMEIAQLGNVVSIKLEKDHFMNRLRFDNYFQPFLTLLDTGSSINLIKVSLIPSSYHISSFSNDKVYRGINDTAVKILGTIDTEMVINNFIFNLQVKVVPDETKYPDCIVGRDFIRENHVKLIYDRDLITIHRKSTFCASKSEKINEAEDFLSQLYSIEVNDSPTSISVADNLDIGDTKIPQGVVNQIKFLFTKYFLNAVKPEKPEIIWNGYRFKLP